MSKTNRQIAEMLSFSRKNGSFKINWDTRVVRDQGWQRSREAFKKIAKLDPSLKVGVQSDEGDYQKGVSVALVAAWNHFGTKHIPSRPYLTMAIDQNSKKLELFSVKIFKKIMDGGDVLKNFGILGEEVVSVIKAMITKLDNPPNAPSTIKRKGSSNPLIETGRLRASQRWAIVNKVGAIIRSSPKSE